MFFAPYVIRGSNAEKVLVQILPASPEDLAATKGTPSWQTDWESEYLSQPSVDKFALKLENGELLGNTRRPCRPSCAVSSRTIPDRSFPCPPIPHARPARSIAARGGS